MSIIPIQNVAFDDTATSAMGEAFDKACKSLQGLGSAAEIIANRIIAAAKNGERDVARLYEQALQAFCIEDKSMLLISVGRDIPDPAYAPVAHAACSSASPAFPPPGSLSLFGVIKLPGPSAF